MSVSLMRSRLLFPLAAGALFLLVASAASAWWDTDGTDYAYVAMDNRGGHWGPENRFWDYDIYSTGTHLSSGHTSPGLGMDGTSGNIMPPGFDFEFYGQPVTEIRVNANGPVLFTTGPTPNDPGNCCSSPAPIPDPGTPSGFVAGIWVDLDTTWWGPIQYELVTHPDRNEDVLVIQFTEVLDSWFMSYHYVQVLLFEDSNVIEVHYEVSESWGIPFSAGLESPDGTRGIQYHHTPGIPFFFWDQAVQYRPNTTNPSAGNFTLVLQEGETVSDTVRPSPHGPAGNVEYRGDPDVYIPPKEGTLVMAPDGSFTYTPPASDYFGTVQFEYVDPNYWGNPGGSFIATLEYLFVNRPPTIDPGPDLSLLPNEGPQEILWATGITPGRPAESDQLLLVTVSNDNPQLFSQEPDLEIDGTDGILRFTTAQDAFGKANVTVTIKDNGGTANGGQDTTVVEFVIDVPFVNHPPTIEPGPSVVEVLEDAGLQEILWATGITPGRPAEAHQKLILTTTHDGPPGLFDVAPELALSGTDGILRFRSAPDAFGTANVTVTVQDDGGTANGGQDTTVVELTIVVQWVNDPPRFTPGPDLTVNVDAGPQVHEAWATDIEPGPANEAWQEVWFEVEATPGGRLLDGPVLHPDGRLTFTPDPTGHGTVHVTVVAANDGGTENGGQDRSAPHVLKVHLNRHPVAQHAPFHVYEDSPPTLLDLLAYASDPDGDPLVLDPDGFGAGPANGTLDLVDGGTAVRYTPHSGFHGTDTFPYTVLDGRGGAGAGTVEVTVLDPSDPLVLLEASIDPPACHDAEVQFLAAAHYHGHRPEAWTWDMDQAAALEHPGPHKYDTATHTFHEPGHHTVTVTVRFDDGTVVQEPMQYASRACHDPVAAFSVTLLGDRHHFRQESHDPDGELVAYAWDFGDGTTSTEPEPVHAYDAPGHYHVRLTVTDDDGFTDTVERVVSWPGPSGALAPAAAPGAGRPTAEVSGPAEARGGQTVALDGAASTPSWVRYAWSQVSGPDVAWLERSGPSASFVAPEVQEGEMLRFSLVVRDGSRVSEPALHELRVVPAAANRVPVAAASAPDEVEAGSSVRLDGSDSYDEDGDPLTYRWEQVAGPSVQWAGSRDAAAARLTAPMVDAATVLTFRLTVDDGRAQDSDEATVRVVPPLAPEAGFSVTPAQDGSNRVAFLPAGEGLLHEWDFGDGSPVSRVAAPVHAYDGPGTYEVMHRAVDAEGREATQRSEVTVPEPPAGPGVGPAVGPGEDVAGVDAEAHAVPGAGAGAVLAGTLLGAWAWACRRRQGRS